MCIGNKDLGVSMPQCSHRRSGNGHSGLQEAGFAGSLCAALTVSLKGLLRRVSWGSALNDYRWFQVLMPSVPTPAASRGPLGALIMEAFSECAMM